MKLTLKSEKQPEKEIQLKYLEPGTIVGFGKKGPIGLVISEETINDKRIILLAHYLCDGHGENWFTTAGGWGSHRITQIFGKLTEIVVDPSI